MAQLRFNGAPEQQSIYPRTSKEYKLYVNNLPLELNEEGVKEIFNNYGKVIGFLCPRGARWAFVTYGSYREAEYALRSINNKSPLYLRVVFAKERESANARLEKCFPESKIDANAWQMEGQIENLTPDCEYNKGPMVRNQEHVKSLPLLGHEGLKPQLPVHEYTSNDDLLYSAGLDSSLYDPYESAETHVNTNVMWMRGNVTVTSDGRRHVTMGRGYTSYELPKSYPRVEEQLGRVFQKRCAGLYEYGEDKLMKEIGQCQYCGRPANMNCQRCNGFYCSKSCQVADWQRHKVDCQEIPPLTGGPDISSLSHSSSDDQLLEPKMSTKIQRGLRRPKKLLEVSNITDSSNPVLAASSNGLSRHSEKEINNSTNCKEIIDTAENKLAKGNIDNLDLKQDIPDHLSPKRVLDNRNQVVSEAQNGVCNKIVEQNQDKPFQRANIKSSSSPIKRDSDNDMQNKSVKYLERNSGFSGTGQSRNNQYRDRNRTNYDDTTNKQVNAKRNLNYQHEKNSETKSYNTNEKGANNEHRGKTENNRNNIDNNIRFSPNRQQLQNHVLKPVTKEEVVKVRSNVLEVEKDFTLQKVIVIPKSKFINVKLIISEGNGIYWVQREEDQEVFVNMMCKLNENADSLQIAEPVVGNMYAVLFEDVWHRAVLTSLNPKRVFYVDFGNEEEPQKDHFRSLNNDFKDSPYFARKISLVKGTSSKYYKLSNNDILSVKALNVDSQGTITVQVEGENIESNPFAPLISIPSNVNRSASVDMEKSTVQTDLKASSSKAPENINALPKMLPSAVDLLTPKMEGCFEVHAALGNNIVAVTLLFSSIEDVLNKVLYELPEACEKMPKDVTLSPKIGDLICGQRADLDWLRGYVVSLGPPLRLAVVDESRVESVYQITPFPEQFADMCTIGATCELLSSNCKLQPKGQHKFEVISLKEIDGRKEIEISIQMEDNTSARALLKHWIPAPEQKGISYARLNSGSEVCLTAYRNQSFLFARSLEIEKLEEYNRILQDVAKCAQTAQQLTKPPVIGQMVIAKYAEDNNYYRAIVTKIEDDKIAVSYVDYGNREIVTLKNLKILSDELKQRSSCVAKILLKDVPKNIPMTKEANDFLAELVGKEQPLTCVFEGIPSVDGVYLKMPNGESVNEKVIQLLEPSWKKEKEEDKTCYMADHLKVASLGEVGETVNVVVLYKLSELAYMMGPQDQELIVHVTDILPTLINEYCKSTKDHYIPRENELCLAPYNGVWYRALCLESNISPNKSSVFFVDFGNMEDVDHKDIRLIKKDFLTAEALASLCTIIDSCPTDNMGQISAKVAARLSDLITPNKCVKVKLIKCHHSGEYEVELPDVRATLIKEGLIES